MNKKLIYLADAKKALIGWETEPTDEEIKHTLDNLKIVDAKKVTHGKWIEDGYNGNPFVCSYCGREGCYSGDFHNKQYYYTNYCPHCGSRMDK